MEKEIRVKNYVYGEKEATNSRKNEKQRMAKLEYSENGDLISSDFTSLDEYIKNTFIPDHIMYEERKNQKDLEKDLFAYVRLTDLLRLNLSEAEVEHVMNYLSDLNIYVNGQSIVFANEFDNYNYKSNYNMKLPKSLSKEEQKRLFKEYEETKSKEVKDKLVKGNMKLVPKFCYKYAKATGIDIEELNSYGYEGLIEAIDSYDSAKGEFSTYAHVHIKRRVLQGVIDISGFRRSKYYQKFNKVRLEVEKRYGEKLIENLDLADEIAKQILNERKRTIGNYSALLHETKRKILIRFPENIDDYAENENLIDDNSLYYQTIEKTALTDMKNKVKAILTQLNDKERKVIEERYGLYGGKVKTHKELCNKFNLSREGIRQRELRALEKLRKLPEMKELMEMNLGEYSFDPNGINNVPNDIFLEKGKLKIKRKN